MDGVVGQQNLQVVDQNRGHLPVPWVVRQDVSQAALSAHPGHRVRAGKLGRSEPLDRHRRRLSVGKIFGATTKKDSNQSN